MGRKLKGGALSKFEAERDVWQEVIDGVREIKRGGGRRSVIKPRSPIETQTKIPAAKSELDPTARQRLDAFREDKRAPHGTENFFMKPFSSNSPSRLRSTKSAGL
jgi:putative transcriptional regulator